MEIHYINILLFAVPLYILAYNNNKPHTTHHAETNRILCECELYAPANYDNDPQMKEVMENFNKQTQQRLHEYDERMKTTRQKCKDKCDKEIEKIILKDKLEKELMDKFATLQTDIQSDAIPTCICEKSVADKTEKFCLNCGKNMGAIAPWWGFVCGVGYAGWKTAATAAAIDFATKAGIKAGVKAVIEYIKEISIFGIALQDVDWSNLITGSNYKSIPGLYDAVKNAVDSCEEAGKLLKGNEPMVSSALTNAEKTFGPAVKAGENAATTKVVAVETTQKGVIDAASIEIYNAIGYSVLAILIIVLIMVIIYLILRHRRKKKMKKKLQYIKLLEE
ncbi:rifin [Plasmodium reichenowi]|uniref:Rifin n=1 Tax=Plasmodium reichenowi TaxID=5854 RepID=A0A060RMG0_PLARE|nr:rifin [Plasmodium reichenowi]